MNDIGSKPVPVRLAYSYSNGVRVSQNARAVSHQNGEMLVLAAEPFEAGTVLSVWAPVFNGRTACRVQRVSPSKRSTGHFEMVLRVLDGTGAQVSGGTGGSNPPETTPSDWTALTGPPPSLPAEAVQSVPPEAPTEALSREALSPEALSEATLARSAHELAGLLENLPSSGFWEAFNRVAASSRRPALMTATAATLHLLEQKGMVHIRSLLLLAKEAAKTP